MEEVHKGCLMIRMGVSGWMFLLVPAHPGSPGQRAVKQLCVCVLLLYTRLIKQHPHLTQASQLSVQTEGTTHCADLLKIARGGLQQLFTVAAPALAVADVRTETDDVQPQCNAVTIPPWERQIQITVNESTPRQWNCARKLNKDDHFQLNTQGEVTSQSLWSRYDRHFVGKTQYNALS